LEARTENGVKPAADGDWMTGLPVDDLVILMPVDISTTAIAVHAEGTLLESGDLPREIFTPGDFLNSGRTVHATSEELARLRLSGIFSPDKNAEIASIPLAPDDPVNGFLVCKLTRSDSLDNVRTMVRRRTDSLRMFLKESRPLVEQLERDLLRVEHDLQHPAVIVDARLQVAGANGAFCELAGRSRSDLTGQSLFDILRLESSLPENLPPYPGHATLTSPLYVKTQALFFVSELRLSRLDTPCGPHTICVFQDLLTHQRTGNSNIQLIQKLSSLVMDGEHPNTLTRRVINVLAATLNCDLVCVLRRKGDHEMLVTPHANRSLESLRANLVSRESEKVLEPFFANGCPVFCADVGETCPREGFFGQVQRMSQFAFVPAGGGNAPEYALLMAWTDPDDSIGPRTMPLLRIAANLLGSILLRSKLVSEMDQESEILRRYTRLTAGREVRMANLKRENASLRELLMKLGNKDKE
jgi:hypothetical protein